MNNYLQEKIKTLPADIEAYLTSIKSDELNVLIAQKYDLTLPQVRAFADLVPQLYLKEIKPQNLVEEIKHIFGFSDHVARQMACDIAGVRLLIIADWLQADIAGLIKSWGGDPARYQSHVNAQQKAVVREAKWLAEQLAEPVIPDYEAESLDTEEQLAKIKNLFAQNLVAALSLDDNYLAGEVNDMIFYLIANVREELKDELANAMLSNNEKLTGQKITVNGKPAEPTIANWLAYFFQQKGSDMFDALALSDFITNAPEAKNLSAEEKRRLSNLLMVYRNLKFFPDSMVSNNPSDWFIFPLTAEEASLTKPATQGAAPASQPAPSVAPSVWRPDAEAQIAELTAMAARYPEGSLERLALEEEIAKLRR